MGQRNRVELTLAQSKIKQMIHDWNDPSLESFRFYSCQPCAQYSACWDTDNKSPKSPFHNCRDKNKRLRESLVGFFQGQELELWCDMAGVNPDKIRLRLNDVTDVLDPPEYRNEIENTYPRRHTWQR